MDAWGPLCRCLAAIATIRGKNCISALVPYSIESSNSSLMLIVTGFIFDGFQISVTGLGTMNSENHLSSFSIVVVTPRF